MRPHKQRGHILASGSWTALGLGLDVFLASVSGSLCGASGIVVRGIGVRFREGLAFLASVGIELQAEVITLSNSRTLKSRVLEQVAERS